MSERDPYEIALDGALGDEIEAAMAEREADGEPYWVERFGDLTAPWPESDGC